MKRITLFGLAVTLASLGAPAAAQDFDENLKWRARFDMGGSIPEDSNLTELEGPVSGQKFKLSPGFQFDLAVTRRLTPWLEVGPELGFNFNSIDAFGESHYPDSSLFQMPIMADVILEYPNAGRLAPYIGAGVGGVASFMTLGANGYWEPDADGSDFVLGFQAFAGVRYRFNNKFSMGVGYRFLATEDQTWDVEWNYGWFAGSHSRIAVDSVRLHQFSLVFAGTF